MMTFGFFPFFFVIPLLFFFGIVRLIMGAVRGFQRDRYVDERTYTSFPRTPSASSEPRQPTQAQLFRLAHKLRGRLTVSDIVVETGLSVSESEALAESVVDGTHVRMEVDDRGIVTYEFPEIIRRFEPGE
ncbi:MAG: hypothetical protein ACLFP4_01450 [Spirochaetales bacterium]